MYSLENFDKQINTPVLNRGIQYFETGAVSDLEETSVGSWQAEVAGNDVYEVNVQLTNSNSVKSYSCNCPFEGAICKHVTAVLFALRKEKTLEISTPQVAADKPLSFDKLLAKVTLKEYKEFVKNYASRSKDFKTAFELAFASKDENIDISKKYLAALKRIIKKNSDHGFVGYHDARGLVRDIGALIADVESMIAKQHFKDAFAISSAMLKEIMNVIQYCDDSDGIIGDTVSEIILLIHHLAKAAPLPLLENVFTFLLSEMKDDVYFEYGDFGYELFSLFEYLSFHLSRSEEFLNHINSQISLLNGEYDSYRRNFFTKRKIEFLRLSGNHAEVEKLIRENLEIVEVRQGEVNKYIEKQDYASAKSLINEGIEIALKKDHTGTASNWKKELLRIAILENDIPAIRTYTKYFAFDRDFSKAYYNQWKSTFTETEWAVIIEEYIAEIVKKIVYRNEANKGKYWYNENPPLLTVLGPVFIEEKFWDRLFDLVKKETNLDVILQYSTLLSKHYPNEILALLLPAFEFEGDRASARNHYAYLAAKMKKAIKDIPEFKDGIISMANLLKSKYPRRPAMVDELSKIVK